MKKSIYLSVLIAIFAVFVVSCGGKTKPSSDSSIKSLSVDNVEWVLQSGVYMNATALPKTTTTYTHPVVIVTNCPKADYAPKTAVNLLIEQTITVTAEDKTTTPYKVKAKVSETP